MPRPFRLPLRAVATFGLALLAANCATVPERLPDGWIEGRVSRGGHPAPGAEVLLLPLEFHLDPEGKPVARAPTGADGTFRLSASPGSYLLIARSEGEFAYFGRNPVHVGSELSGIHLPLVPAHPVEPRRDNPGAESLTGRVLLDGEPVEGAKVFAYVEASRGLRGPGYAVSEPTAADGGYRLDLEPGTYFVGARLRTAGWRMGSLNPGDLYGVLPEFPLRIRTGQVLAADIEVVQVPSREQMARYQGRFARLSGTVVDLAGLPLAGFRACLYDNAQMLDRPSAVSEPTGADGRFTLETSLSGRFHLGARETLGAPPKPGERVGFLRGSTGASVQIDAGSAVEDLTIVVQVVP